jgi:hypothetical protein
VGKHAAFDQFVVCCDTGTRYRDQRPTKGRHHDRVWPALSRYKRHRHKARWCSHRHASANRAIEASSMLTVLKHWYPCHPLEAWHMRAADRAQRPPRFDP